MQTPQQIYQLQECSLHADLGHTCKYLHTCLLKSSELYEPMFRLYKLIHNFNMVQNNTYLWLGTPFPSH